MKRVFSLALAALLLAGCTATPADSGASSAAVTAETSTTQEAETTAAAPSSAAALRPLWLGDEKQYYMNEMVTGELIRYRVADLVNHVTEVPCDVEGCAHDSESCPAVFRRGECDRVFVLDDDTLVAFTNNQFPETKDSQVILLDRDCQNRRVVATIPNSCFLSMMGGDSFSSPYTDEQSLYCFGYTNASNGESALFRIELENGTVTNLLENAPAQGLQFLGTLENLFVFSQSDVTYPEPTGDLTADALASPTGTTTHWLFDPYTGEWKVFQTYSSGEWNLDLLDIRIVDGQYYVVDRTAGALYTVDPTTGEKREITNQLPTSDRNDYSAHYWVAAKLNDWLVFDDLSVIINADTGEVRQRAYLPDNCWNGSAHQPNIYLNLGDTLLVDCRYEPYTRTIIGTDGMPYTVDVEHEYLGLISTEDFLNGVPNYTEVGEYII